MRHAKAGFGDHSVPDYERTLSRQGIDNIKQMGSHFSSLDFNPDLIISSPAVRALSTAMLFVSFLEYADDAILQNRNIYAAEIDDLYSVIHGLEEIYDIVMFVGHNPGLTDLLDDLTDAGIENIPACGLAVLKFREDQWPLIKRNSGILESYSTPADYQV